MVDIASLLAGGDRRSIGQAEAVLALLRRDAARFDNVFSCLMHADPLVRMRAADALEKFSRDNAASFTPHQGALLARTLEDGTAEMRWHLIAITARLPLDTGQAVSFCQYLEERLRHDDSRIVKVAALQAACDLGGQHAALAERVGRMLRFARASVWPSLRARANILASKDKSTSFLKKRSKKLFSVGARGAIRK